MEAQFIESIHKSLNGQPPLTRFAPSPTGYLHLGHVVNALHVWGIARTIGGKVILRIEDHDQSRCKPEYEASILQDLEWLGLQPDLGLPAEFRAGPTPWRQTDCIPHYEAALELLRAQGRIYACTCSRQQIRARTQQADVEELAYDGHCRDLNHAPAPGNMLRVRLGDETVCFDDLLCGPQDQHPASQCGDFVVLDRHGNWTYQFAVVVDDLRQGVNLVIRGQDLLSSTGRQVLLQRMLGQDTPPKYAHHGLLLAPDGRKMSKRDFSTDIHTLFLQGIAPEVVIGQAAHMAGWQVVPDPMDLATALRLAAALNI